MRKIGIAIGVVVLVSAVAFVAAARHAGSRAEEIYRALVAEARQQAPQLQIDTAEYKRGLLGATAVTRVIVPVLPSAGKDGQAADTSAEARTLLLNHEIAHGPFVLRRLPDAPGGFAQGVAVTTVAQWPVAWREAAKDIKPRNIAVMRMGGAMDTRTIVPAFDKTITESGKTVKVSFRNLDTEVALEPGFKNGRGAGSWAGMDISGDKGRMTLEGATFTWNFRKTPNDLYAGESIVSLLSIKGDLPKDDIAFSSLPFEIRTRQDEQNGAFNFFAGGKGGAVTVKSGKVYGPLEVETEVRNLDAAAMASLRRELLAIQAKGMDPEAAGQQMALAFMNLFPKVVAKGPELTLRQFALATPHGRFAMDMNIRLPAKEFPSQQSAAQLFGYAKEIFAQGHVTAPEALVLAAISNALRDQLGQVDIPGMIEPMPELGESEDSLKAEELLDESSQQGAEEVLERVLESGMVKREGDKLISSFSLTGGKLTVNGQDIPLPLPE